VKKCGHARIPGIKSNRIARSPEGYNEFDTGQLPDWDLITAPDIWIEADA
jgi:hypothetical protein